MNLKSYPMRTISHIHFIGIGGSGMSPIAEILHHEGYRITGSDVAMSSQVKHLQELGITVFLGHSAQQVHGADVLVVSSAIEPSNPEWIEAKIRHIPVVPRAQMLAELMRFRYGLAIAGTHGKTTTTSLVTAILAEAGRDPTFVIGGLLNSMGTHAKLGTGSYLVVEADESDASFLHLNPIMTIVTNIDNDHLSNYGGDFQNIINTFYEFIHRMPFYGLAVLCYEDPYLRAMMPTLSRPYVTYGWSNEADVWAEEVEKKGWKTQFKVHRAHRPDLDIELNLPGKHNVLNALAAIAMTSDLGIEDDAMIRALSQFQGVGRRLQRWGSLELNGKKVLWLDDYGHHPRELKATLSAIKDSFPDQRIVMVFQPHRYSRTRDLFEDFTDVLSQVPALLLLEVYAASEMPIVGADSKSLCRAIRSRARVEPVYLSELDRLAETLGPLLQDNDVVIMQGAGNVGALARQMFEKYGQAPEVEHV